VIGPGHFQRIDIGRGDLGERRIALGATVIAGIGPFVARRGQSQIAGQHGATQSAEVITQVRNIDRGMEIPCMA
jgi:hypothetical protein